MPLGPSEVRIASLTAFAAFMLDRRTSSGLSAFLNARCPLVRPVWAIDAGTGPAVADMMMMMDYGDTWEEERALCLKLDRVHASRSLRCLCCGNEGARTRNTLIEPCIHQPHHHH